MKNTFWFLFWLLAGLIVGGLLASACASVGFLSWLAYGQTVSFSPAADFIVFQFDLNAQFSINLAQIICVLLAMVCYHHFRF